LVERVLSQNISHHKIGSFRGVDSIDFNGTVGKSESREERLEMLWQYQIEKTRGYVIKSIAWNQENPDIVAVGYGWDDSDVDKGLICCWNMKNLEFPEKIFEIPSSVTSLGFSKQSPNLLAVGVHTGVIYLFNVASKSTDWIFDTKDLIGKHIGPVWSLKWIQRERGSDEKIEVLISCSSDGRVVQWTVRKGLQSLDLMKVKRVQSKLRKNQAKKENLRKNENGKISHLAPTISFDFNPKDGNTYIIGTEEGMIHRCSCSYNEQVLDTYEGHTGSVYSVKWHDSVENIFLSCSEDWTVRLWHQKVYQPVMTFQSSQLPVNHVQWSPYASSVFISVADSSIYIWDLQKSILDPVMTVPVLSGGKLKKLGFAPNSNSIFIGDSDGNIQIYKVHGFEGDSRTELIELIDASMKLN